MGAQNILLRNITYNQSKMIFVLLPFISLTPTLLLLLSSISTEIRVNIYIFITDVEARYRSIPRIQASNILTYQRLASRKMLAMNPLLSAYSRPKEIIERLSIFASIASLTKNSLASPL